MNRAVPGEGPSDATGDLTRRRQDEAAVRVLDALLGDLELPPFIPGEPWGMAASRAAHRVGPAVVDRLSSIYGIYKWDHEAFTTYILEGALAAWKPGTRVEDRDGGWRVASPTCPLGSDAARDPRLCHTCRVVHEFMVRRALGWDLVRVIFEGAIARGDRECALVIEWAHDEGQRGPGTTTSAGVNPGGPEP